MAGEWVGGCVRSYACICYVRAYVYACMRACMYTSVRDRCTTVVRMLCQERRTVTAIQGDDLNRWTTVVRMLCQERRTVTAIQGDDLNRWTCRLLHSRVLNTHLTVVTFLIYPNHIDHDT